MKHLILEEHNIILHVNEIKMVMPVDHETYKTEILTCTGWIKSKYTVKEIKAFIMAAQ